MSRRRAATARARVNASANANVRPLGKAPDNNAHPPVSTLKEETKERTPLSNAAMCAMRCGAVLCHCCRNHGRSQWLTVRTKGRPSAGMECFDFQTGGGKQLRDVPRLVTLVERDPGNRCLPGPVAGQPSLCWPPSNGAQRPRAAGSGCPAMPPLPRMRWLSVDVDSAQEHTATHTAHCITARDERSAILWWYQQVYLVSVLCN